MGALSEDVRRAHQRHALVSVTALAVVADALLMPFYPRLFATSFGVTEPAHVGRYLAATCLTVMVALPLWARVERRVPTLHLLMVTQLGAGGFSLACAATSHLAAFWALSLAMVACKGAYLLIYPYLLRLESKREHASTVAALTVIVHMGAITGAALGGWLLEHFTPQHAFFLMALGDFAQMGVCLWLAARRPLRTPSPQAPPRRVEAHAEGRFMGKLCALMALFYFGAFVVRPFFAPYWTAVSGRVDSLTAGVTFAIPGWISLLCVVLERRFGPWRPSVGNLGVLGVAGLLMQASPDAATVVLGRAAFGLCVFKTMVRLDVLLFEVSEQHAYAVDFGRVHFFQQLGVLVAFYAAGTLVSHGGLRAPFVVAAAALAAASVWLPRLSLPQRTHCQPVTAS